MFSGTGVRRASRPTVLLAVLMRVSTIVLVGVIITFAVAAYLVQRPPVYWSQVEIVFVAPTSASYPNNLRIMPSSLVETAGVVSQMVTRSDSTTRVAAATVTLAGEGITHGSAVTLPNSGGQWANNYTQAVLDVQATGPTIDATSGTMKRLIGDINQSLAQIQATAGVADVNMVHTLRSPPSTPIYRAGGSRARAAIATLTLGLSLTAAAAAAARRRRGSRRSPPGPWLDRNERTSIE